MLMKYFMAHGALCHKYPNYSQKDLFTIVDRFNKSKVFKDLLPCNDKQSRVCAQPNEMKCTPAAVMMILALMTVVLQKDSIVALVI